MTQRRIGRENKPGEGPHADPPARGGGSLRAGFGRPDRVAALDIPNFPMSLPLRHILLITCNSPQSSANPAPPLGQFQIT